MCVCADVYCARVLSYQKETRENNGGAGGGGGGGVLRLQKHWNLE